MIPFSESDLWSEYEQRKGSKIEDFRAKEMEEAGRIAASFAPIFAELFHGETNFEERFSEVEDA